MLEKKLLNKAPLKILVPTDLTPPRSITSILSKFSQLRLIKLTIMHVISSFLPKFLLKKTFYDETYNLKLSYWGKLLSKGKFSYQPFLRKGNIAQEIIYQAKKSKIDLILFDEKESANTYTNETSMLPQQIVRYSNKSVWICKSKKISRILCAVDGSKSSKNALTSGLELSRLFSSKLMIIHTFPHIDFDPSGMDEHIVWKLNSEFENKCIKKIEKFINHIDPLTKRKIKTLYMRGSPASNILDVAKDQNINLIIMGAKGHSLLDEVFVGSTVEKVMPFTPCSLLIVR